MEEYTDGISGAEKKEIINCFVKSNKSLYELSKRVRDNQFRVLINENLNTLMFACIWFGFSNLAGNHWSVTCIKILWGLLSIQAFFRLFNLFKELKESEKK